MGILKPVNFRLDCASGGHAERTIVVAHVLDPGSEENHDVHDTSNDSGLVDHNFCD